MARTGLDRNAAEGAAIREFYVFEQRLTTQLNRQLRPLGITVTGFSYLMHLESVGGRAALTELAAAMQATQSSVSKTTKTLRDGGSVVIEGVRGDGRRKDVVLTAEGENTLREGERAMQSVVSPLLAELSVHEVAKFGERLASLADRLDD